MDFPHGSVVKSAAMQETQETRVQSLEEEVAAHSSVHAWKILWTEKPGRLQSMGSELDTTEQLHTRVPHL